MDTAERSTVLHTCRVLLRPVASFLMKCGMTWREFADVSKSVFVEVAGDEYGIKGRPTNVSRVSILTGISRKEVKRQRELMNVERRQPENRTTDATRVLSGWHQDPDFLDQDGRPKILPRNGNGASFELLCRRYAGDIQTITMIKELKRVSAVTEDDDQHLTVLRRYYMPAQFDTQWVVNAGSIYEDLGANINFNLTANPAGPSHFLGRASDDAIEPDAVPEFREFIEEHGQPFIEMVDDWLTAHRGNGSDDDGERVRLGVGMFLIQGGNMVKSRGNKS